MNTGALNFFANYRPTNFNNKLNCYFNFENLYENNLLIPSFGKYKNNVTGYILPSTGNFWNYKPNVGFISGNYIKIENIKNTDFNFKNFSYILSCEKLNYNGGVLLSSISKDSKDFISTNGNIEQKEYYKGFEFGITANNYLYFEYFKNNGPDISISEHKVNDKSVIYLNIVNNNVNYGFIDFNNSRMVNKSFTISSNYLFDPTGLYIGYNPLAEFLYSNNQNFVGYIEDIILASPFLFDYEILNLSSGFIYDFRSGFQYITSFITTGITGSYNLITGYQTRITGYQRVATGEFTNPWGVTVMGYINEPLIVQIPLSGTFYLSGQIINTVTGFSGVSFNKNNSKLLSYQTNVINILNKITNEDLIEFNFLTGYSNSIFNKKNIFIEYDRFSNSYQNLARNESFYNIFVNGQLQKSGNLYFSDSPYENNSLIIENDYGINKQDRDRIIFNNFYGLQGESSVFIDVNNSGNLDFQNIENYPYISFDDNKYNLFLNGQKLTKGIHYDNKVVYDNDYKYVISGTNWTKFKEDFIFIAGPDSLLIYTGSMNSGWGLKQKIINPSSQYNGFGSVFDISENNNTLVIGAPYEDFASGAIFVYTGDIINGWNFKTKLTVQSFIRNTEFNQGSQFGSYVYINYDGSIIIGGQPSDEENELYLNFYSPGAASIFTGNNIDGWILKQKLIGESGGAYSKVVSSYYNNILFMYGSVELNGSIIIYTGDKNNGWLRFQKITGDYDYDYQNKDIAINNEGTQLFVGANKYISVEFDPFVIYNLNIGAIHLFTGSINNLWYLDKIIDNPKPTLDRLGDNVSSVIDFQDSSFAEKININNNILTIFNPRYWGDPYVPSEYSYVGSVYIFSGDLNNNWNFLQMITGLRDEIPTSTTIYNNYAINPNGDSIIMAANNFNSIIIEINNATDFTKYYFNDQYFGSLTAIPKNYDLNSLTSGTSVLNLNNNFYYNNTELYINGVRQTLNYDYLELSDNDISSGVKILLENNKDYIYNNEGFIK